MPDPSPPGDFHPPAKKAVDNVGSAYMETDGTLEMRLRTETDDGSIGEAYLVIAPADPRYKAMVKHLDGIKPGEGRTIKPFPAESS
jgi:hypothetical protein